jgi:hypothetical protein
MAQSKNSFCIFRYAQYLVLNETCGALRLMPTERDSDLEQLEELFTGQLEADPDGIFMFPGGALAADPLSWAAHARRALGDRVRIYGFWCFENPQASLLGELRERHDFAVIDRRWIVDLWLRRFYSGEAAGIVDLDDEESYAGARPLYGDPGAWERDLDMETRIDRQLGLISGPAPAGVSADAEIMADFST